MGCGKTATGQVLAKKLMWQFVDIDSACEDFAGMSIAEIFAHQGEASFRGYEANQIAKLSDTKKVVIATGGGAVLMEANRRHLKTCSSVIFLDASIKTQVIRTGDNSKRPLLDQDNPYPTLKKLYLERKQLYQSVADYTINADHQLPAQIADKIINLLQLGT